MVDSDVLQVPGEVAPVLETDADGRLYYDGERTGFSRLDRSYIAAAAKAFADGKDIALVYPSPPTHMQIPILLAVGFQSRSTEPTLFVSNRTGIREQYFNIGIGSKYSPEDIDPTPLADMTAPMVKTGDGSQLSYITHHKPEHWDPENPDTAAIVHTTFGKKITRTLDDELELSGFVLDFTTSLLEDDQAQAGYRRLAEERDIPRVMLFDSPNHPYLEQLEEENDGGDDIVFWGWSGSTIAKSPVSLLEPVTQTSTRSDDPLSADGGAIPSPFTDSERSLENIRQGIERSITEVPYGDLQPLAKAAYQRLHDASQFPKGLPDSYSHSSRGVITKAYFLYMYLDTLPISVEFHDSLTALDDTTSWGTSKTLSGKVDQIRSQLEILDDDVPGSSGVLEEVCDLFDEIIECLTVHNPKADAIAEEIRTAREDDKTVCLFTATRKQESLLRSFIAEKTELAEGDALSESIFFQSLYNPHTVPETDVAIFPGVPTKSHYPAIQTGAAPEQRFLTYSWSRNRLENRLEDIVETAEWRVGPGSQYFAVESLEIDDHQLEDYVDKAEPRGPAPRQWGDTKTADEGPSVFTSESRTSSVRSTSEEDRIGTSPTLTGGDVSFDIDSVVPDQGEDEGYDAWRSEIEFDDGEERETIDEGRMQDRGDREDGETQAIQISFEEGDYIYEERQSLVWALEDANNGNVRRVRRAATALDPGDQIVLIHDDSRRDVFEHVVEKIHEECRGSFRRNLMMLSLWNDAVDQIIDYWKEIEAAHNSDPSAMNVDMGLRDMAEMIADDLSVYAEEYDVPEADRKAQAVYDWLTHDRLGPGTIEPIRALGELYDVEVLKNHSAEIDSGLDAVRDLHRNVGRKLSKIIFSTGREDSDEWLMELSLIHI